MPFDFASVLVLSPCLTLIKFLAPDIAIVICGNACRSAIAQVPGVQNGPLGIRSHKGRQDLLRSRSTRHGEKQPVTCIGCLPRFSESFGAAATSLFIKTQPRHSSRCDEGATSIQDQGTRGRTGLVRIYDAGRSSRGAWAPSEHDLDYTQGKSQGVWPLTKNHQSHFGGTTATANGANQASRLHLGKIRRSLRRQSKSVATIC